MDDDERPRLKVLFELPQSTSGFFVQTFIANPRDGQILRTASGIVQSFDLAGLCVAYTRESLASPRDAAAALRARRKFEAERKTAGSS